MSDIGHLPLIVPDWPAPRRVRAFVTTRLGGVSSAPWHSFNPSKNSGDDPLAVAENRRRLRAELPAEPFWLKQVHGVQCVAAGGDENEADASFTSQPGVVCTVLTADCLPVLMCDRAGTVVGAAHAGWRGLLGGVIEATAAQLNAACSDELMAWFGPAIGPQAFEVGGEVRDAFVAEDPAAAAAFTPFRSHKFLCNIYALADLRLQRAGVCRAASADFCTVTDSERFFSYRRDGVTGRMASCIWLEA
jgi:YfiH family protein